MVMKTKHTLFVLLIFTLSMFLFCSCSEPYDPAVVPETEVFSPIYISEPEVAETYDMFKLRFAEAINRSNTTEKTEYTINTYRTYRVTEKDLSNQDRLFAVFAVKDYNYIKETWPYEQFDEPNPYNPDYDGRLYYLETEQVEQMARELFGKEVKLTHEIPRCRDDMLCYPNYNNEKERYEWKGILGGGDFGNDYYSIPTSAEKSENYLIIYDKYLNVGDIVFDDQLGSFYGESTFYGDSEFINVIEIPNKYTDEYKIVNDKYTSETLPSPYLNYETKEEAILKYGTPYKHVFKLAEDGTYFWVSSEPIVESDNSKEDHSLTEIPFEGNLEAAYEAICNFKPFRRTNSDTVTVYQPKRVTFDDLASEYVLALAYDILPEQKREIIVADGGIYSENSFVNGEYITEDIQYTVFTANEMNEAVKTLFGEDVRVEHKSFLSGYGIQGLTYDGEKYLKYSLGFGGSYGFSDYSIVSHAETDGEFAYVIDKFISFEYDYNEDEDMIVSAIYNDGAQTDLICDGNNVPQIYRVTPVGDHENEKVTYLYSGRFPGLVVFGDMMQTYKHTFKLAEDGTYFWVSSEPINED